MLLTEARRPARADSQGALIPLDEQDRELWDGELIAEGAALIAEAWRRASVGEYQVQAAIAAVHDLAARPQDPDWPEILALYGLLEPRSASSAASFARRFAIGSMATRPCQTGWPSVPSSSDSIRNTSSGLASARRRRRRRSPRLGSRCR